MKTDPTQSKWEQRLPWLITGVFVCWILSTLRPGADKSEYNLREFAKLPVLLNGRIQPFDSVARNSLLMIRGKQSVAIEKSSASEAGSLGPDEWILEVMTRPQDADQRKVFRIDHPDIKSLLKLAPEEKNFSFDQVKGGWEEVEKQADRINDIDAKLRTPFEKQLSKFHFGLVLYFRLKNSLRPENTEDFVAEVEEYRSRIKPGLVAVQKSQAGEDYNKEDLQAFAEAFRRYDMLSKAAYPLIIPPTDVAKSRDQWVAVGSSLRESMRSGEIHPAVLYYARISSAYGKKKPADFNQAVGEYRDWLAARNFAPEIKKGQREAFFNGYAPFIKSMTVYLAAFVLACGYWFKWSKWMNRTAFQLVAVALLVHTSGLIFRMVLEGRPPVTNLYSSAIFVGWGAAVLGLILEKIYRDGIGAVVASAVGFITLVIAHNLSLDGDTMELLQAVLDTNFWLATHVVIVTLGYASTFLSGFLAIVYVLRGVFTPTLTAATAKSLSRMVYGIVCFSTLFSFVGTILGGIWADQSWGRFWGWDPKENGALLIVIWAATILHARWGGMIREKGLMVMAILGNIITSFSWFGVNMLGVGLHSYGFMDQAFKWLMVFDVSQLLLVALALMPNRYWKSFKAGPPTNTPTKKSDTKPSEPKPILDIGVGVKTAKKAFQ